MIFNANQKQTTKQFIYKKKIPRSLCAPNSKRKLIKRLQKNIELKIKVPHFLQPIEFYILPFDIIIYDLQGCKREKEKHSFFEALNHFKKPIQIIYEEESKCLLFYLENQGSQSIAHSKLLVDRLMSLGDNDAYELSLRVNNFINNQFMTQVLSNTEEEKENMIMKNENNYQNFLHNIENEIGKRTFYPLLIHKYHINKNSEKVELYQLGFNEKMSEFIKEDNYQKLTLDILQNGFPEFLFMEGNIFKQFSSTFDTCADQLDDLKKKYSTFSSTTAVIISELTKQFFNFNIFVEWYVFYEENFFELIALSSFKPAHQIKYFSNEEFTKTSKKPTINPIYDECLYDFLKNHYNHLIYDEAEAQASQKEIKRCGFRDQI